VFESKRPIAHVAADLGVHKEALRSWVRQAERDGGGRQDGLTSVEREELARLRGEVKQLRKANEIFKAQARWDARSFLPRLPDSLEQLDLLLLTVSRPRKVHPDGIHFQDLRYQDPTLAAYVGEAVVIRYDLAEIHRVRRDQGAPALHRALRRRAPRALHRTSATARPASARPSPHATTPTGTSCSPSSTSFGCSRRPSTSS
jgi:transposase-like protein